MFAQRAVMYRETTSRMYHKAIFGVSYIFAELPFVFFNICCALPIIYFMAGLPPANFGFQLLVTWLFAVVLASMGQLAAALFPMAQPAQMTIGLLLPILIVYCGLYVPPASLPSGLVWVNTIDPLTRVINTLVPTIFHCEGGADACPTITRQTPAGPVVTTVSDYLQAQYKVDYAGRWDNVGYLVIFIAVFQALHMLCIRFISHIKR
jgi:ABC-type multidrug transport system permease subunit